MNENKPANDAHAQRRRRVLRGAISAPVVLTISSGAGAQMASNLRCVAHQVTNPPGARTVAPGTGVPATVVRVQLRKSGSTYYVGGDELRPIARSSHPYVGIASGEFRQFNMTSNTLMGPPGITSPVPPLTSPAEYAVVQIRQDGYIQTVGANTGTTTSMIYGTCWASFKLAP